MIYDINDQLENGIVLVHGSDIVAEPIQWLWKDWLALGKLHILAGDPGTGKTTIAMRIAASVSSGTNWSDGSQCDKGRVLIWSGEDDYKDTLQPRLIASGANTEMISYIAYSQNNGVRALFDPAKHILELQRAVDSLEDVKLIIVDPIVSAITGDSHKNSETRRDLQPLVDLAMRSNVALLGITHLSKGSAGNDPIARVLGSVAFTAVPRVVLLATKTLSDDGDETRILVRAKSNIGPDGDGFEYDIVQSEPIPGIHASTIEWGEPVYGPARELIGIDNRTDFCDHLPRTNALERATSFLKSILSKGPMPSNSVLQIAKEHGHSERTVRRAKEKLGVINSKSSEGPWYWTLPVNLAKNVPTTNLDNMDNFESEEEDDPFQ